MADETQPDTPKVDIGEQNVRMNFAKVDVSKTQGARFYANHVAANITVFDVRLILSDVEVVGEGAVAALQSITVLMSPELAVLTHKVLGRAIENYTKNFGKHRLPEHSFADQVPEPPKE